MASGHWKRAASTREFWAGVLFLAAGAGFLAYSSLYRMGTPDRMGPGFVPVVLAVLLMLLGIGGALRGFGAHAQAIEPGSVRPLAIIVAAVVLFGVLLPLLGLVLATAVLVLVGTFAGPAGSWAGRLALAAALAVGAALVFVKGLGVAAPLWPV